MTKLFSELKIHHGFASSLPHYFYTVLPMSGLREPQLLHVNHDVASRLEIEPELYQSKEFLAVMSGNQDLPGGKTLAAVYSGHQFGVWAGQLGDGRAHLLGDIQVSPEDPNKTLEIQLKGAGLTPYSRMGDGRAVLRSSLREYLCSAAMKGLGIPTTEALSIVTSDDRVRRETLETAAIVARVAPSFIRFGSFQHWQAQQRPDLMEILLNYTVDNFMPEINQTVKAFTSNTKTVQLEQKTCAFLREVVRRTARLMAAWQGVGFVHGVMNTDNMSILGLTIDYGPFAFMDGFHANYVANHSDSEGRYAWNKQASVGLWNLYQLANALVLLVDNKELLKQALDEYESDFSQEFKRLMVAKLGLHSWQEEDQDLLDKWWELLQRQHIDFTLAHRYLSKAWRSPENFLDLFHRPEMAEDWLALYHQRVQSESQLVKLTDEAREDLMNQHNPLYVLRTWIAQEAIEQVQAGNLHYLERLMTVLQNPFVEHEGCEAWSGLPPSWSQNIHLSCSS